MTDLNQKIIRLGLYETKAIVPMATFTPDTYTQRLLTEGNSILSSLFVESMDMGASVQVNYWDYGAGSESGERFNLTSHNFITAPTIPTPDRILVTKLHNKPVVEIIVTGGNVRLGIYITVVASFASDLDSALKKDAQVADLLNDKGMPAITYDPNQGKFYMLRSEQGVIPVSFSEAGTIFHDQSSDVTTPGVQQTLIDVSVPGGFTRKLTEVVVVCRSHGSYIVESDGAIIGSGRTGPATPKDVMTWNPRRSIPATKDIKVKFTADSAAPVSNVESYVMATDT
jgi:hypothetical protein